MNKKGRMVGSKNKPRTILHAPTLRIARIANAVTEWMVADVDYDNDRYLELTHEAREAMRAFLNIVWPSLRRQSNFRHHLDYREESDAEAYERRMERHNGAF